jgi:hypothetical protein
MSTPLALYTLVHVLISLFAIGCGFVVMYDLVRSRISRRTVGLFLAATLLTSVSGFGFPAEHITPGHVLGVLSLLALCVAIYARYARKLLGRWRTTFVVSGFTAQYLNVFVLIVQSFLKVPVLHAMAPTQTEWPFVLVQGATLIAFVVWGFAATTQFLPVAATARSRAAA